MKTGNLLSKAIIMCALSIIFLIPMMSFAQPMYTFKNPTLVSGTALTKGAVYRFSTIKAGVDAIVTITDMTNGITLSDIDGTSSGYNEAFQPFINAPKSNEGYVEFRFDFVKTGTNTAAAQAYVPFTAIDIDGDPGPGGKVNEFDQFKTDATFRENYSTVSNELTISTTSGWREARNRTSTSYGGIDTVTKSVMYTASYRNVSSVSYRTGAKNTYGSIQNRLRSVYFKDFIFAGGLLPLVGLDNFTGVVANHGADLKMELAAGNTFSALTIEKNDNNKGFIPVVTLPVSNNDINQTLTWHDNQDVEGTVIYRIKAIALDGKVEYSSSLVLKGQQMTTSFKVFPNMVQTDATLSMSSSRNTQVTIRIADLSGRIVSQQRAQLFSGNNSVQLQGLSNLNRGNYVVVVDGEDLRQAQQIVKL